MIRIMGLLLIVLLSASAYAENGCPRGYAWYQGKCVQVEKNNSYTVIPAPTQEQIDARAESQIGQGIGRLIGSILGSLFSSGKSEQVPVASQEKNAAVAETNPQASN